LALASSLSSLLALKRKPRAKQLQEERPNQPYSLLLSTRRRLLLQAFDPSRVETREEPLAQNEAAKLANAADTAAQRRPRTPWTLLDDGQKYGIQRGLLYVIIQLLI